MSRKRVEVNPIRGERLKMLLIENGVDQKEFADKIGYTKEHISYIINGRRNLTEDAAQAIIKLFPGTRIEWLMGYDDFKTNHEKGWKPFVDSINKGRDESERLTKGLAYFLSLSDYKIVYNDIGKESMPVEEAIEWYTKKLVILKHGEREVYLSPFDLSDLENEILGYIELRLKYLLESKWRDKKNG